MPGACTTAPFVRPSLSYTMVSNLPHDNSERASAAATTTAATCWPRVPDAGARCPVSLHKMWLPSLPPDAGPAGVDAPAGRRPRRVEPVHVKDRPRYARLQQTGPPRREACSGGGPGGEAADEARARGRIRLQRGAPHAGGWARRWDRQADHALHQGDDEPPVEARSLSRRGQLRWADQGGPGFSGRGGEDPQRRRGPWLGGDSRPCWSRFVHVCVRACVLVDASAWGYTPSWSSPLQLAIVAQQRSASRAAPMAQGQYKSHIRYHADWLLR